MCRTKELAVASAQDPDTGLVTLLDRKAMGGKTTAQDAGAGRIGAGGSDRVAHDGQVDAFSFGGLVQVRGEGGNGTVALRQGGTKLVSDFAMALGP